MILKLCKKALIVNVLLLEKSSFFPNVTMTIQDLNSKNSMNITTKKNKTIFYLSVSLVCVMILVSFLIVWFGIIKG